MFELFHECGSRGYLNREMNRQTNARSISPRDMRGDLAKIEESQTKLREVNNCQQVAFVFEFLEKTTLFLACYSTCFVNFLFKAMDFHLLWTMSSIRVRLPL